MTTAKMETVSIPINIDAFALCLDSCNGDAKLAPITQPNYMGLRLDSSLIQHDLLEHVDFHRAQPAEQNPRISNIGSRPPEFRLNRLGIHLHWSLPRLYRTGTADADGRTAPTQASDPKDASQPVFKKVPNRWLLVRNLISCQPAEMLPKLQFQAWLIESDRLRKIINSDNPEDWKIDLESEVSPFVAYDTKSSNPDVDAPLMTQAEVFIGKKTLLQDLASDAAGEYIDLTVMNSSNPLFPDYALHNFNVFSTIDNFQYKIKPDDADYLYLTQAHADYYVLGWHSDSDDEILPASKKLPLSERLRRLMLTLGDDQNSKDIGALPDSTRVLLHGAIYSVDYDRNKRPDCAADKAAKKFGPTTAIEPLSVGSTAIDGILTFLNAHKDETDKVFETDSPTPTPIPSTTSPPGTTPTPSNISTLVKDIIALSQFLYASEDSYDARTKASDLLFQNNFAVSAGGKQWTYAGKPDQNGVASQPSATRPKDHPELLSDVENLQLLNQCEIRLDATQRKLLSSQWNLFATWWKFVSDQENATSKTKKSNYSNDVKNLVKEIQTLQGIRDDMTGTITKTKALVDCKISSAAPFFTRKDPTLCVAALDSGWPVDYMDALAIRLYHQLLGDDAVTSIVKKNVEFGNALSNILKLLPLDDTLKATARKLLVESFAPQTVGDGKHITGFKKWTQNPFIPLFLEYEVLYYHIPFNQWDVRVRSGLVRYGVSEEIAEDETKQKEIEGDWRVATGRVLILPQPVFSLEATVNAVIDSAGTLPLKPEDVQFIKDHIKELKFISAPLDGITDHLLTRANGGHVIPTVRQQGQKPEPLKAAVKAGQVDDLLDSDLVGQALSLIEGQSSLTPYGNLFNFGKDYPNVPFKPVTHGQMMFTKINIIDKFGQAICMPDPLPQPKDPQPAPPTVYPCISDYFMPEKMADGRLNTIYSEIKPSDIGKCRFIQLPPSINQAARVNMAFVRPTSPGTAFQGWHETTDFEQPIFAWIIVNYANYGLQFFLPDGTFYREIRMGGVDGTNTSAKWLPFDPPAPGVLDVNQVLQLDELISKLTDKKDTKGEYLQGFFDMINGSIKNMPYPPSEYAGFANAIVGKPLALVNVGFSLELATPAITPQNTLGKQPIDVEADLKAYSFPFKIGDLERPFDAVVGYYDATNDATLSTNGTTNFNELFTYFAPNPITSPVTRKITPIEPSNFPQMSPWYTHPESTSAVTVATDRTSHLLVKTLLIDPYTPIHAYSPILPIKTLQLPAWTIQSAFKRMTAFFRLGPCLITSDVAPLYDPLNPLKPDTWIAKSDAATMAAAQAKTDTAAIKLPIAGTKGLWQWLQPYPSIDATSPEPRFNSLDVGEEDTRLRQDPAPYTFVEGYLQLARPLIREDIGA